MKKYISKIVLFFAVVAIVDFGYGKVCDYLRDNAKGGYAAKMHYICEQCDENIVMMGSSRMHHHYVPQVFEDTLNMSCFNAGIDGNGIILSYGLLKMILERYSPEMIVYDFSGFDIYKDDNTKYLDYMKPYYWDESASVSNIFYDVKPIEKYKMRSNMYRYNSKLFQLLGDKYHPKNSWVKGGYFPIYNTMDIEPKPPTEEDLNREVDSLKYNYLVKFIELAQDKNVQLFFVASPTYYGNLKETDNEPMRELSAKMNLVFYDHYYDSLLSSSKEYWSNGVHLNNEGAIAFSKTIASEIKQLME